MYKKAAVEPVVHHEPVADTSRPDTPELEGGTPQPEEVTGRASATDESLGLDLFDNGSAEHLADGFRGGSDDDEDVAIPKEGEAEVTRDE